MNIYQQNNVLIIMNCVNESDPRSNVHYFH